MIQLKKTVEDAFYEGYLHATLEVAACLDSNHTDGHYIWNKLCDNLQTMKDKIEAREMRSEK